MLSPFDCRFLLPAIAFAPYSQHFFKKGEQTQQKKQPPWRFFSTKTAVFFPNLLLFSLTLCPKVLCDTPSSKHCYPLEGLFFPNHLTTNRIWYLPFEGNLFLLCPKARPKRLFFFAKATGENAGDPLRTAVPNCSLAAFPAMPYSAKSSLNFRQPPPCTCCKNVPSEWLRHNAHIQSRP